MRDIHELLKELKGYIEFHGLGTGLCCEVRNLLSSGNILVEEYFMLVRFIKSNRPKECTDIYWYPEGELEPRIAWLDKHIRKTRPSLIRRIFNLIGI